MRYLEGAYGKFRARKNEIELSLGGSAGIGGKIGGIRGAQVRSLQEIPQFAFSFEGIAVSSENEGFANFFQEREQIPELLVSAFFPRER